MRRHGGLEAAKHTVGLVLHTRSWPSRKMLRRQTAEIRELRRFARLADGCAQSVVEGYDNLTKTR